jgi:glycerate dehydrogenase
MKIVVLDGYTENPGDISWEPLEKLGELTVYDRTSYIESPLIAERIADAEIAVINKTPVSRETINKCPNLKAIAVLATGYNVVDYEYAAEKGITVMNVPVYGTDNVSQFAVSLLMEVCSHIGHHSESVHAGEWASCRDWCYWHYPMIEVSGKTAGIIGLGRIGTNTAKILKAMNVRVLAYDQNQHDAGRAVAEYVGLDELFAESDFIFLHCPLSRQHRES